MLAGACPCRAGPRPRSDARPTTARTRPRVGPRAARPARRACRSARHRSQRVALCTAHFRQLQPGPTAAARPASARRDLVQLSADAPRAGIGSRRVLTHIHNSDTMPAAAGRCSLPRRVPMTDNPHALPRGNSEEHAASRPRLEPSVGHVREARGGAAAGDVLVRGEAHGVARRRAGRRSGRRVERRAAPGMVCFRVLLFRGM